MRIWVGRPGLEQQITNGPPAPAAYAASDPTGHKLGESVDRSDRSRKAGARNESDWAGSEALNVIGHAASRVSRNGEAGTSGRTWPYGDSTVIRRSILGIVVSALLISGCDIIGPQACTDELGWRVTPTELHLKPGESATVTAEGLTCGGRKSLEVDMRWSSDDPGIATVEEASGRVKGVAAGTTKIRGEDHGPYGIPPVTIPVTVMISNG